MNATITRTKAEQQLSDAFAAVEGRLPGGGWVRELRRSALGAFASHGLPHRRIEEWKYTDLRERLRDVPPPAAGTPAPVAPTAAALATALGPMADIDADRIVLVDGRLVPGLSNLERLRGAAIELRSLADTLAAAPPWLKDKFDAKAIDMPGKGIAALNLAFMSDGVMLKVKAGGRPERPVLIVHVRTASEPSSSAVRNIFAVEKGAALMLIEAHVALAGAALKAVANSVTDLALAEDAAVDHIKWAGEGSEAAHLSGWRVDIGERAGYRAFQLSAGIGLARHDLDVRFSGPGAKLDLSAIMLGRGGDHIDTTLIVDHAVPGCVSRELVKTVLDGRARSVFQGKVIVRPGAQKTDGKQMAQALMLSPDAEFDSKPELEIYADDVVCGHGSTAAELDEDLLFYLRARGIPLAEARSLLISSFVGEALDKVVDDQVRAALTAVAESWLALGKDR